MIGKCGIVYLVLTLCLWQSYAFVESPPMIVKQPPTDELLFQVGVDSDEHDKPFMIECEAECEPTPQYKWTKNGKPFNWQAYDDRISQQPGRGTLLFSFPRDEDEGQYQCFAENKLGIATSNSVFVRKAILNPFVDSQSENVSGIEGEPYMLPCSPPDGWPKPRIQWTIHAIEGGIKSINNSRMTVDPEGNLWFSNVTRDDQSDDFYYVCAAVSAVRNEYKFGKRIALQVVTSGISTLYNRHPPKQQYVTRKNEVADLGKRFEIYCIYGGTPLPQIIWSKDGRMLRFSDRIIQGNYGKSLVIKDVMFEDAGEYTCDVSNGVGSAASYSMNLMVQAVPFFTIEPQTKTSAENETVEFHCEASGVPEPEIKWVYNGKPISEAPPNPRLRVFTNSIIIDELRKGDTGNYGCNASNSLGYVYKDVYVNVVALPPEIKEPFQGWETVDGRTVTLMCKVFGVPKPQVKWMRAGQEVTGGRFTILENGDLQIQDVEFNDDGEYTCYASNKFGSVEKSGKLTVKKHTEIIHAPEDYEAEEGKHAKFRCQAVADDTLNVQIDWLYNDQLIDFDAEPRFIKSPDSSLQISKTTELDSGTYTCVAKTDLDEAKAHAYLIVQDVPNPPELLEVVCNEKDATIKWLPKGDNRSPISHYIVQFSTSFTPDTWEVAYDSIPPFEMECNVPLNSGTTYTFRVLAQNKIGRSLPSGNSEVCTMQGNAPQENQENVKVPLEAPTNFTLVAILGPTRAVLSWNPVDIDSIRGEFKGYKIETWTDSESNSQEIYINKNISTAVVTKFVPYTKNYARISVLNSKYSGPPSETLCFDTPEDVPGPVQYLDTSLMGSYSLYVYWKKPAQINGILTGYNIYYQVANGTQLSDMIAREPQVIDPDQLGAKLSGLEPNTKYRIHVRATTKAGEGDVYFIERKTREETYTEPNTPVFTLSRLSDEDGLVTIRVDWIIDHNGNSGGVFFVEYRLSEDITFQKSDVEFNETFIYIPGLQPNKTYEFKIVAVDGYFYVESATQEVGTWT